MKKLGACVLCFLFILSACGYQNDGDQYNQSQVQVIKTNLYEVSIPDHWNVEKEPGSSLSFQKDNVEIGRMDILNYDPEKPVSQLEPNHSEIIETKQLDDFFTKVIQMKLKMTPPAASGKTESVEQIHYFIILKDKEITYDLLFNSSIVSEETGLEIVESFKLN